MKQPSPDEKPYKMRWLEAERELAIRGFPLQSPRRVIPQTRVSRIPFPLGYTPRLRPPTPSR